MRDRPSKTDHAEQMAGVRMRAEHNAACVAAGKTVGGPTRNDE